MQYRDYLFSCIWQMGVMVMVQPCILKIPRFVSRPEYVLPIQSFRIFEKILWQYLPHRMPRSNPYLFTIHYHLSPDIRRIVSHPLEPPLFSDLNMRGLCSCDSEYLELSALPYQCYRVQKRVGNLNTMKTVCVSYVIHLCFLHTSPVISCIRINVKLSVSTL